MAAGFIARQTYTEEASTDTPAPREEPIPKREFEGHKDTIWSFVFLHDNVHIVSGSEDGTMRKWNCDTGLAVGKPWKGSGARGGVYALALSPDGKRIACGRWDGGVQRWNTDSGKMIGAVWRGHSNAVVSLSWSPGGRRIASGSDAGTILLRSAKNGKTDVGPIKTKQDWVESLAYSPLGDRIASGGRNSTICIWNTQTGKLVIDPIKGLGWSVTSIVWSLDSSKLYSTSDTSARIIQLWDTESYQLLHEPFRQSRHALRSVLFSQNGKYLAHGGDNGVLTLWMVKDIAAQFSVPMPGRATPRQLLPVPESQSSSRLDVSTLTFDCPSFFTHSTVTG
ncbi:WD40 repeat-like protein [Suillus weaverae]|nr:WD40 repeat-like protein [Suillus weaverae]